MKELHCIYYTNWWNIAFWVGFLVQLLVLDRDKGLHLHVLIIVVVIKMLLKQATLYFYLILASKSQGIFIDGSHGRAELIIMMETLPNVGPK